MSTVSEPKCCPKCGSPIPAEAPQGLCPKCLMMEAAAPTEGAGSATTQSTPPSREDLAAAFPQLEILEFIGQGGMGFVFKARQRKLDRFVALKILPPTLASNPAFAERFAREGRALARLNHPNIVTIHDFGETNGHFYLLMEFVDGVNLRQAMKVGRFTPAQALAIVPKICEALQFAHNEGILHRDIKPENILLDAKGRVKIADFGIAKLVADRDRSSRQPGGTEPVAPGYLTETGKALGTPQYMAPEQLERPQEVDQRADIYSLGVVFYEMLTGELPIGRFAPPSKKSSTDPRVDDVVLRALEKERERRYQQASEVKTDVETIVGGAGSTHGPVGSTPMETAKSVAEPPWQLILVAILFIVSGCFAAWEIGHGVWRHTYELNVGVLALPIGLGLLRRRPGWRYAALAALWFGFALVLLTAGLVAAGHTLHPTKVNLLLATEVPGAAQLWVGLTRAGLAILLLAWMYRVLVRSDVKSLFRRGRFVRPWIEWATLAAALVLAPTASWLLLETGLDRINTIFTADSFGPAVEGAVYLDHPEQEFLDLSTGDYVHMPNDVNGTDWTSEALRAWLADERGAGAMATVERDETRLALCHTTCRPVSNRCWDKPWLLNAVEVGLLTIPPSAIDPVDVLARQKLPSTFAFHAADRVAGLVQILGYTANPPGVKIRYKLARRNAMSALNATQPREPGESAHRTSAAVPALGSATSEAKFVMTAARFDVAHLEPGELNWGFNCFVPPGHLAAILFVCWTNGVPSVVPGFSAYFKVPKTGGIDVPFCSVSCEPIPGSQVSRMTNAESRALLATWGPSPPLPPGFTNLVQWNVNLGLGFTGSRWMAMPPYRGRQLDLPQSLPSGHQLAIRLVDFVEPPTVEIHGWSGVELRILLQPLSSLPVRMTSNEIDRTNYIAGSGLPGSMEEALKALKQWPTDP